MLVKALPLRHLGRRLTADELQCVPMVGNLRVEAELTRRQDRAIARMAILLPLNNAVDPLIQLHAIRLLKVDNRGMLIAGIEEHWQRKQRTDYRQALWCWPVDEERLTAERARDPIDVAEEDDQVRSASL